MAKVSSRRQLSAIFVKNLLVKVANWKGFFVEMALPVAFMFLLALLKSITTEYKPPNVSYSCGTESLPTTPWAPDSCDLFGTVTPECKTALSDFVGCHVPPENATTTSSPSCTKNNYFRKEIKSADAVVANETFTLWPGLDISNPFYQYEDARLYGFIGWVSSFWSFGVGNVNQQQVYSAFETLGEMSLGSYYENPSLPLCQIITQLAIPSGSDCVYGPTFEPGPCSLLALAPSDTPAGGNASAIVDAFSDYLSGLCNSEQVSMAVRKFEDESAMDDYITAKDYDDFPPTKPKVGLGIVFNGVPGTDDWQWDYSIRTNYTFVKYGEQSQPTVACLYGGGYTCPFQYTIPPTRGQPTDTTVLLPFTDTSYEYVYGYSYSGFLTLQQGVDQFIMETTSAGGAPALAAGVGLMPKAAYTTDDFQNVISQVLGLFFMLSFLFPVSRIVRALVLEKELKIKEGMKMMGLSDAVFNLSWFLTLFLQMTVLCVLITLVIGHTVFEHSDRTLVFLWFWSFCISVITLCALMSVFFSKSKTAAAIGTMAFFGLYFPYYAVQDPISISYAEKHAACILSPTCFALGATVIGELEGSLVGVHWSNAGDETQNFRFDTCVRMMFLDALLYGLLAWYLDQVLPTEFGTQRPFYFLFTRDYWCGSAPTAATATATATPLLESSSSQLTQALLPTCEGDEEGKMSDGFAPAHSSARFEAVGSELTQQIAEGRAVSLRGLRKVFKTTAEDKVAVKSLDLDLFEGQITVLLGHNGAGKSTTINMLTGLMPATSGDAVVAGHRISNDMRGVRESLGVCPQHDTLFPDLTVIQHLRMFGALKGVPGPRVESEALRMIAEVGLTEKVHAPSSALSGGMKRKLSLAIALIGDSRVVVLDEPTSGMDPYSRRSTWNILQRNKKGRVILLTTHFMDEADILGDRIAIMADGELRCVGSSLFLKSKYGVGYTMTVVKQEHGGGGAEDAVSKFVLGHVPSAELISDVGAELQYRMPFQASGAFRGLFTGFDEAKTRLGVSSVGISVTTLEEVFMRVAEGNAEDDERRLTREASQRISHTRRSFSNLVDPPPTPAFATVTKSPLSINAASPLPVPLPSSSSSSSDDFAEASGWTVFRVHMRALIKKRSIYLLRDKKSILFQLVIPVCLVLLGLLLLIVKPSEQMPSLTLNAFSMFNTKLSDDYYRNPVPFLLETASTGDNLNLTAFFDGDVAAGSVEGTAVTVTADGQSDQFDGCAPETDIMSDFLLGRSDLADNERGASRYGAVTVTANTPDALEFTVLVNASAVHGAGVFINLVDAAAVKALALQTEPIPGLRAEDIGITVRNAPLPRTYRQSQIGAAADAFTAALMIMIAFAFLPASFAIFVVKERECKAKHQQVISGVSIWAYWLSTFAWDTLSYLVPAGLSIVLFVAFGIDSYTQNEAFVTTVVLFLAFGPAVAAFTYILTFLFKSHSTAQNAVLMVNMLTGLCLMITSFVMSLIESTQDLNKTLKYVYRLFPGFCLGDGLTQLSFCDKGRDCMPLGSIYKAGGPDTVGPWDWEVAGGDIWFLVLESVVYMSIALSIEFGLSFPWIVAKCTGWTVRDPRDDDDGWPRVDEDVAAEGRRVASGQAAGEVVVLDALRKVYPGPKVAVKGLSFGIPRGECFGFLGINGAGKTTTLSILSGEFPPTRGDAFIGGFDIQADQGKIRRKIGYCPQFDALLELLTVREHLVLYGRIKGIPKDEIDAAVDAKIVQMDLGQFENKAAGSLSGGNKRKLSVAIAMMGEPSIVFLDEPSTGMDPVARRFMWEVVSRLSTRDGLCSVILTTHSMEEAEALCSRIGIMVNGAMQCLGSAQHLKSRFGNGFEVDIKCEPPTVADTRAAFQSLADAGFVTRGAMAAANHDDLEVTTPLLRDGADLDSATMESGNASGERDEQRERLEADMSGAFVVTAEAGPRPGQRRSVDEIEALFPFERACMALGDGSRARQMAPLHEICAALGGDRVPAKAFVEWWLCEERCETLAAFVRSTFGDGAELLERSTALSFRYRVPQDPGSAAGQASGQSTSSLSLSRVFGALEDNKARAGISEYSVGQTTLEQIFNQFAASQENPENVVTADENK